MSPLQWLQVIAALASALTAALVWALRKPPAEAQGPVLAAKDAEIAALQGELDALRELTPIRIREFLLTTRSQLQDYCALVEDGYQTALAEGQRIPDGPAQAARQLQLDTGARAIKGSLRALQHQVDYPESILVKLPVVDPATLATLTDQCLALTGPNPALSRLSSVLQEAFRYRLDETTLFSNLQFSRPGQPGLPAESWLRPDNGE